MDTLYWLRRLDRPYSIEVGTPYQAQIRRIFLDGYGVLDVRTMSVMELLPNFSQETSGEASIACSDLLVKLPDKEYVQYETEKALRNAIVYDDALTSELEFSSEPTVSSQHVDKVYLKNETSLSEYDDEEYNVISYNDLFSFNIISVNELKLDTDNDDDKIDIKQSSGDISIEPLRNVNRFCIRKHMKEIHVIWALFWKNPDKIATLHNEGLKICLQKVETASGLLAMLSG
ncbi:hypothetical protein Tco_1312140 [Tanacetum coccineum]